MWRTFAERHQTTRQLAISFIKTGVPNVVLPPSPTAASAAAGVTTFQQAATPANSPIVGGAAAQGGQGGSGPAIAWVGVNTHVTEGSDLDPKQQSQDAFEKFAKAIQSPATLKSAKVKLPLSVDCTSTTISHAAAVAS